MARRAVYQYQPINETPDVAIGIPLPFNKSAKGHVDYFRAAAYGDTQNYASGSLSGGSVFAQTYSTQEQAVSNLKNLLLTFKGERFMQPNFGTRIREILFDNNTTDMRDRLRQTLNEDIKFWLPYIEINAVDLESSEDMHSLFIKLHFVVTTIGSEMVINILANENEYMVSDAEVDAQVQLNQVDTFGQGSAFGLDAGGSVGQAPGVGGVAVGGAGGY